MIMFVLLGYCKLKIIFRFSRLINDSIKRLAINFNCCF